MTTVCNISLGVTDGEIEHIVVALEQIVENLRSANIPSKLLRANLSVTHIDNNVAQNRRIAANAEIFLLKYPIHILRIGITAFRIIKA